MITITLVVLLTCEACRRPCIFLVYSGARGQFFLRYHCFYNLCKGGFDFCMDGNVRLRRGELRVFKDFPTIE